MDFSSSDVKEVDGFRPSPPKSGERVLSEWTSWRTSTSKGRLDEERILERVRR